MSTTLPKRLTSRPATMDDVEAAVELANACSIELIGRPEWEAHRFRIDWESDALNPQTDLRVVFAPGGKLVGYAGVWDTEPYVQPYGWGNVHPDYKGQGIGIYLAQWVEERARQAISQAPEGARVAVLQERLSTDAAARTLLLQQGYRVLRHGFRMLIEMDEDILLPEPVFPEGVTVHAFDRERQLRDLILAMREIFVDEWGYVERPFEEAYKDTVRWIKSIPDYDPSVWFLAMDGEEIVGMSLCLLKMVEDPEMAFIDGVGVQRAWRRRGVALALLHHSFRELHRRGKRRVSLDVDAQSLTGATRLYEKAGMHVQRQNVVYEKELRPGEELRTESL